MSIELITKYSPKVDEVFKSESKTGLITNTDYDWEGAHTVKVYKITTAEMNDYTRNWTGTGDEPISRYGSLKDLSATTETLVLSKDRSFIFNVDQLDTNESAMVAEQCLARQIREVVNPERDKYIYNKMATLNVESYTPVPVSKADFKWYDSILKGGMAMDQAEVPDTERVLVLNPEGYAALKKELTQPAYGSLSEQQKASGIIGYLDGMEVIKVPSSYLPEDFAFMIVHPSACVAPVKLSDFGIHENTPLSSGTVVTGRICYDAFILDNKQKGIYYQSFAKKTS